MQHLQCRVYLFPMQYVFKVSMSPDSVATCKHLVFTCKWDSYAPAVCFCMCRLTGRAVFCRKLLLGRGILIEVPREESDQGVDVLAAYLAPRLDAATEGTLATYYM